MIRKLKEVENVYLTESELIITGNPITIDDDDEYSHNCDQMGCSSCEHILLKMPLIYVLRGYNELLQEELQ